MSEHAEHKKKKSKKDKSGTDSDFDSAPDMNGDSFQSGQSAEGRKIVELEEQVRILESRFRILEDMVPNELRNLSDRLTNIGQWVGYDKGEKKA